MTATFPTTDESALLAAIRANHADDAPRLIYADWLEENGESERAQFIRVQVELEKRIEPRGFNPMGEELAIVIGDIDEYDSLRRRERELLKANSKKWITFSDQGTPCLIGNNVDLKFERGFVHTVTAPFATLMGEKCGRCRGREYVRDERREEYNRRIGKITEAVPIMSCPSCLGRGRTPGVLSAIMQSRCAAIERVTASDKRPDNLQLSFWNIITQTQNDYHYLPQEIWDLIDLPIVWDGRNAFGNAGKAAKSETAAMEALSRAMIKFACRDS